MIFNFSSNDLALLEQAVDDKIESLRVESKYLGTGEKSDLDFSSYEDLLERFKTNKVLSLEEIEGKILALMDESLEAEEENSVGYERGYEDGKHDAFIEVFYALGIQHNFTYRN